MAARSRPIRAHLDPAVRQLDLVLALGQLARRVLHVPVVVACQHEIVSSSRYLLFVRGLLIISQPLTHM